MLLSQLPTDARAARIVDERLQWTTTDHLLANVVDMLRGISWQLGGGKGQRPRPIPRPGDVNRRRMGKARPLSEAKTLLDRWKAGELAPSSN